jgi:hypothetical protein
VAHCFSAWDAGAQSWGHAALKYAVREGQLSVNPLDGVSDPEWKAPDISGAVDRRRVASPAQMEKLIAAVGTVGRTQGPTAQGAVWLHVLRHAPSV